MPTRVVDLGEPNGELKPRLFITGGCPGRYLALSYSWGDGTRHAIQLTRKTIQEYQNGIPTEGITLSHWEAMHIASQLGYRYIWIDAFGIIQDDKNDWLTESRRVSDVYMNAELTLVAGRSDQSKKGFLKPRYQAPLPACPILYSRPGTEIPPGALCYLAVRRSTETGPVDKRAWCFQEAVLSQRMIVYGMEQIGFHCQAGRISEDNKFSAGRFDAGRNSGLLETPTDPKTSIEVMLRRWYSLTSTYSAKDIYDPRDNFATTNAVAAQYQLVLKSRYLAGH